ncbi:MAG: hypothetical protein EXR73_03850 [Myxococcales bacterium]|nr:hypothetical protein [Myxococcales bacterium]
MLFREALVRSPAGVLAPSLRDLLARCNGVVPPAPPALTPPAPVLLDPYALAPAAVVPVLLDPYAQPPSPHPDAALLEPPDATDASPPPLPPHHYAKARRDLTLHAAAYGALTGGLVLWADDQSDASIIPLLAGLGAAATWFAVGDRKLSESQTVALSRAPLLGSALAVLLAHSGDDPADDCFGCVDDSPPRDYVTASIIGGAAGLTLAAAAGDRLGSPGDVALTASLAAHLGLAGMLVGVAMQPVQQRAVSVNGVVGASIGLTAGLLLAPRVDVSRGRVAQVDLVTGLALLPGLLVVAASGEGSHSAKSGALVALGLGGLGNYLGWRLSGGTVIAPLPVPRPMLSPADPSRLAWGIDLAAGRF